MSNINVSNLRFVINRYSFASFVRFGVEFGKFESQHGFPCIYSVSEEHYSFENDFCHAVALISKQSVVQNDFQNSTDLANMVEKQNKDHLYEDGFIKNGFYSISKIDDKSVENLINKDLIVRFNDNNSICDQELLIRIEERFNVTKYLIFNDPKSFWTEYNSEIERVINDDSCEVFEMNILLDENGTPYGWIREKRDESMSKR